MVGNPDSTDCPPQPHRYTEPVTDGILTMTTNDVDRIETEIAQCKDALRSPRIGLFESRRLFRRLESLYRELDRLLEKDLEHA